MLGSWWPCWGHVEPTFGQEHRCPKRKTHRFWVIVMDLHWVDVGTYLWVLPPFTIYFCFYSPNSVLPRVLTTLLDGVSAFLRPCLPASLPLVSPRLSPGWCARLPEALSCPPCQLVSHLFSQLVLDLVSRLVSLPACPPSCFVSQLVSQPLSQLVSQVVFLLVAFVWMVCRPS